jgi:hypothetical protein
LSGEDRSDVPEEADPGVPRVEQSERSAIRAADVVEEHRVDVEPVHPTGGEHDRDVAESLRPQVIGCAARGHEHEALDLTTDEIGDQLAFA